MEKCVLGAPPHRSLIIGGSRFTSFILAGLFVLAYRLKNSSPQGMLHNANAELTLSRCSSLHLKPVTPLNLLPRERSDRFEPATKPTLLKNARIWTGEGNGTEVVYGNIFLDNGLIRKVGDVVLSTLPSDIAVVDLGGAWVTPGIVDIHSNLGDSPIPFLGGAMDLSSPNGLVQPWLRSLDALNTHDEAYSLNIAGGVTTSLVFPGSDNSISGQAFTIKMRKTTERTPTSMLLEPPYNVNALFPAPNLPVRWRHIKHACGENIRMGPLESSRATQLGRTQFSSGFGGWGNITRMDTAWSWREAYATAKKVMLLQDSYCEKVQQERWDELGDSLFPEDLRWEALVDVLRGRVKVHIYCQEAVDLDTLVRLSNEFEFPIAVVHHASEAYLVPTILKRAFSDSPAVALFALRARYSREASRASEFAPRILNDHGLRVVMKSDQPVTNSRYLLYEAQLAHYYGLEEYKALSSVTAYPAEVMGLGWRIGYIKEGWDADLVVWDSHPLALGATPSHVFIDGIPQLDTPHSVRKPPAFQKTPKVPNFDKEANQAVKYDGLPPLIPEKAYSEFIAFMNVRSVWVKGPLGVTQLFSSQDQTAHGVVLCHRGKIVCTGAEDLCLGATNDGYQIDTFDLDGGEISPSLISFGSPLGLSHIEEEPSANDGFIHDTLKGRLPGLLREEDSVVRALDGLELGSRDAFLAYREGVAAAITAPSHHGFFAGLSAYFSTSALHRFDHQPVWQDVAGLHVTVESSEEMPGTSTRITILKKLLLSGAEGGAKEWWKQVVEGTMPLIVEAHSADVIATLILLKRDAEVYHRRRLKLTVTGASEAHLLAKELAVADVGIVMNPVRPFPSTWERRRILQGPPFTPQSAIAKLLAQNVTVGIGVENPWSARTTRLDLAWVAIESGHHITKEQALALGSTNLEKLLTGMIDTEASELVATKGGGLLDLESRVVALISPKKGLVHIL